VKKLVNKLKKKMSLLVHGVYLEGSVWIDSNGNMWSANKYSRKEAASMSATMLGSYGCLNCMSCIYCKECIECIECSLCERCLRCVGCRACNHSKNKKHDYGRYDLGDPK
jgi:hypothetical protein